MSEKYHISSKGNVVKCRATKGPCRAQAPEGMIQVHGESDGVVYNAIAQQFHNITKVIKNRKLPEDFTPTDEVIGAPETDAERLIEHKSLPISANVRENSFWLKDTEGNNMGYIKFFVNQKTQELDLCDIEVRPQYRGRKLSHRMIKAAEKKYGMKMLHKGGYTPEGFKAVASLFHSSEELPKIEKSNFDSMSFVHNWDLGLSKFN